MTGATGRLGRALLHALADRGTPTMQWSRPDYDLDDPSAAHRVFERDHPAIVIHAAAWTDVDGCARDPAIAMRRNAYAVAELAEACAGGGARLVIVSTNEVFDGERTDGRGYAETDSARPLNAYGASKLAAERHAASAFERADRSGDLVVARTAWLFGPPGNDFPAKILKGADALPTGQPLAVVADEIGSPTYTVDLAQAVLQLAMMAAASGTYHLVNEGSAARLDVAARVLQTCRPDRPTTAMSRTDFRRASTPPAWGVLENTRARALGVTLRPWQQALDAYAPALCSA